MAPRRIEEDYSPRDYEFPELYSELGAGGKCIWVDEAGGKYYRDPCEDCIKLCMMPYEQAWMKIVDPVKAEITAKAALVIPWEGRRALYLKPGVKVKLIEAYGIDVSHVSFEGERVGPRTVLAYVLTGKGETRTLRAGEEGIVALILTDLSEAPPRYVYALIREEDAIWLEPGQ